MVQDIDKANPEDFIHLFLNKSERLVEFLEHLVKTDTKLVHRISYSNGVLDIVFCNLYVLTQVEYFGI